MAGYVMLAVSNGMGAIVEWHVVRDNRLCVCVCSWLPCELNEYPSLSTCVTSTLQAR